MLEAAISSFLIKAFPRTERLLATFIFSKVLIEPVAVILEATTSSLRKNMFPRTERFLVIFIS